MKTVVIEIKTAPDLLCGRVRLAIKRGSIPALLESEIYDAVSDWEKFENNNGKNRFEKFRCKSRLR